MMPVFWCQSENTLRHNPVIMRPLHENEKRCAREQSTKDAHMPRVTVYSTFAPRESFAGYQNDYDQAIPLLRAVLPRLVH